MWYDPGSLCKLHAGTKLGRKHDIFPLNFPTADRNDNDIDMIYWKYGSFYVWIYKNAINYTGK